jgi:hypothetical protein
LRVKPPVIGQDEMAFMIKVDLFDCGEFIHCPHIQAISEAPPGIRASSAARGEHAVNACAEAIRDGKLAVPKAVKEYFLAYPGPLSSLLLALCLFVLLSLPCRLPIRTHS